MAAYQYDEGGSMAAYFSITFLTLILIPFTLSLLKSPKKQNISGCQCGPCVNQRERIRIKNRRSIFNPKVGTHALFVTGGWVLFAALAYKIATTKNEAGKLYDPFEILGIGYGTPDKEIKSHYKQLSRKFHPDKVKLAVNQTAESVAAYFVEITKAYKSLTDETIKKNWEIYGHPDGRQEISMGIAIPRWVVEGNNKVFVLLAYCALIGGFLPYVVGKWWFGNQIKTKDGVFVKTAEVFFKSIKEESSYEDEIESLGKVFEWEHPVSAPLNELEKEVRQKIGGKYSGSRAQTLLYAHLFRIKITDSKLVKEQEKVLLQTPVLLSSMLNIIMARNWLLPTLSAMRLHAYIAQAIPPTTASIPTSKLAQLPGFTTEDVDSELEKDIDLPQFVEALKKKGDERAAEVTKAAERWGRLEIVDAAFKVVGERIVTPSSIVQLLLKARINPPIGHVGESTLSEDVDDVKRNLRVNEEKDNAFLASRKDAEDVPDGTNVASWAHAPYWPVNRKPSWWFLLADAKTNRVVVPPLKITDVPFSDPSKSRNYRAYKIQFQVPAGVGMYTWKLYLVSDTFVGEEVVRDIVLKVDDVSSLSAEEQTAEDEISDPEEDTLAGQMAAMRGGKVKKIGEDDDSDDSSTDDEKDNKGGDDDSSDSD